MAEMETIAGPLLLGYMFNWGLFGALCIQVYWYALSFPTDRLAVKAIVCIVFLLEFAQTLIATRDAFQTFARNFGNPAALASVQTQWLALPVIIGVVSSIVQVYYGYRVYALSLSKSLSLTIALIALLQGGAGVVAGARAYLIGDWDQLVEGVFVETIIWLAGSAACDVLIAISMTFLLLRKHSEIAATHMLVIRLVHLIIETGVLTATVAAVDLGLFLGFPQNSYHVCVALMLGKLYSNSLLVLLNARVHLPQPDCHSFQLNKTSFDVAHPIPLFRTDSLHRAEIRIQQETWVDATSGVDELTSDERNRYGAKKSRSLDET